MRAHDGSQVVLKLAIRGKVKRQAVLREGVANLGQERDDRIRGVRIGKASHAAVALMIAHDLPMKLISDRLGRSDIGITVNRDGHLIMSVDDAAMERQQAAYQTSVDPGQQS